MASGLSSLGHMLSGPLHPLENCKGKAARPPRPVQTRTRVPTWPTALRPVGFEARASVPLILKNCPKK